MTLAELINEVYTITGRPDLVNETVTAIRKATLKLHQVDYFYRDLEETVVSFPATAYKQQYDIQANFPDYRSLKYVREWNQVPTGRELFLDKVEPDVLLDDYAREKTNVWYIAGTKLNIKCSKQLTNAIIGYYKNPVVTTNGYNSWIAIVQPYAIIEEAAATIFKMIGHDAMAVAYRQMVADQIQLLTTNYFDPQAR